MEISQTAKIFSEFFFTFSKFIFNFQHFQTKKMTVTADVFLKLRTP